MQYLQCYWSCCMHKCKDNACVNDMSVGAELSRGIFCMAPPDSSTGHASVSTTGAASAWLLTAYNTCTWHSIFFCKNNRL